MIAGRWYVQLAAIWHWYLPSCIDVTFWFCCCFCFFSPFNLVLINWNGWQCQHALAVCALKDKLFKHLCLMFVHVGFVLMFVYVGVFVVVVCVCRFCFDVCVCRFCFDVCVCRFCFDVCVCRFCFGVCRFCFDVCVCRFCFDVCVCRFYFDVCVGACFVDWLEKNFILYEKSVETWICLRQFDCPEVTLCS